MTTDLREKIAEVLAGHRAVAFNDALACMCNKPFWALDVTGTIDDALTAHRWHVAEAILAAIGDRVLPEGGEFAEGGVVPTGRVYRVWQDGPEIKVDGPVDTEDPRRAPTEEAP